MPFLVYIVRCALGCVMLCALCSVLLLTCSVDRGLRALCEVCSRSALAEEHCVQFLVACKGVPFDMLSFVCKFQSGCASLAVPNFCILSM